MGKPYPQIVQDIFLSPFLFFYISNMPNFASSKTRCGASRHANTPRKACSLDCTTKLRFAFQPAPAGKTVTPYISLSRQPSFAHSRPTPFRPIFSTEHHTFRPQLPPSRRQPEQPFAGHLLDQPQPPASPQPSFRLDRPVYSLSYFFSLFLPFQSMPKKNRGQPAKPILLYFSYNSKSSPNLVQASPSQSLSLLFSPSNQYTLLHRPRSGHT